MWIKNLFSKRKPNHLIVFIDHNKKDNGLFTVFSKFLHSIGPHQKIDNAISDINEFKKKYDNKLDFIIVMSNGKGKHLVNTREGDEKVLEMLLELKPLLKENGSLLFGTCFVGSINRRLVEISEKLDGIKIVAPDTIANYFTSPFRLFKHGKMCSCKDKNYSKKLIDSLPKSKYGMSYDELRLIDINRRAENETINWESCGMAYEYNKRTIEDGICENITQPWLAIDGIKNYFFNVQ